MRIDKRLQKSANKLYRKYGVPEDKNENMKNLAESMARWGYNIKIKDALKVLEIAQRNSRKKSN